MPFLATGLRQPWLRFVVVSAAIAAGFLPPLLRAQLDVPTDPGAFTTLSTDSTLGGDNANASSEAIASVNYNNTLVYARVDLSNDGELQIFTAAIGPSTLDNVQEVLRVPSVDEEQNGDDSLHLVIHRGDLLVYGGDDDSVSMRRGTATTTPTDFASYSWTDPKDVEPYPGTFSVEQTAVAVLSADDGSGTVTSDVYLLAVEDGGLHLYRSADGESFQFRSFFGLNNVDEVLSVDMTPVQIADGSSVLAIGLITEDSDDNPTFSFYVFDGQSLRATPPTPQPPGTYQTLRTVTLAPGTLAGSTERRNVLQAVLRVDLGGFKYALVRAEYDLGFGDPTQGSWVQFPHNGGTSAFVDTGLIDGAQTTADNRDTQFSAITLTQLTDATRGVAAGGQNHVMLLRIPLNSDSNAAFPTLFGYVRPSNQLLSYGYKKTGNEVVETLGEESQAAALNDPDSDFGSWTYLGAVYGPPPFARNGASSVDGLSSVTFTRQTSDQTIYTTKYQNTVGVGYKNTSLLGIFNLDDSIKYQFFNQDAETDGLTVTFSEVLESSDALDPNTGVLYFLYPRVRTQALRVADWNGNLLSPDGTPANAITFYHTAFLGAEVYSLPFDMTATTQPAYAQGIGTAWSAVNLRGWENADFSQTGQGYDQLTTLNVLQLANFSPDPSVVVQTVSTSDITTSNQVTISLNNAIFGFGVSEEFVFQTSVETKSTLTFGLTIEQQFTAPTGPAPEGETFYTSYDVQPYMLIASDGQDPFFVPDAFKGRGYRPFCLTYGTDNLVVHRSLGAAPSPTPPTIRGVTNSVPRNLRIGEGRSRTLRVRASGFANARYHWFLDGRPIRDGERFAGARGSTLRLKRVDALSAGRYSVEVRDADGTARLAVTRLTAAAAPQLQRDLRATAENGATTLSVDVAGSNLRYIWRRGGEVLRVTRQPELRLRGEVAGEFTVVARNRWGSAMSGPLTLR